MTSTATFAGTGTQLYLKIYILQINLFKFSGFYSVPSIAIYVLTAYECREGDINLRAWLVMLSVDMLVCMLNYVAAQISSPWRRLP